MSDFHPSFVDMIQQSLYPQCYVRRINSVLLSDELYNIAHTLTNYNSHVVVIVVSVKLSSVHTVLLQLTTPML
jgi:hypothetical protein